ncbi:IS3 family transposase [Chryseobacterium sp. A301]
MRLVELSNIRVRYGVQRLHILLRREGWKDNHKRIYRIYCEEGLNLRRKRNKRIKSARFPVSTHGIASSLHVCCIMDYMSDALFKIDNGPEFISNALDRDWESGKSSVVEMIHKSYEWNEDFLCIKFNGWIFEER